MQAQSFRFYSFQRSLILHFGLSNNSHKAMTKSRFCYRYELSIKVQISKFSMETLVLHKGSVATTPTPQGVTGTHHTSFNSVRLECRNQAGIAS